MFLHYNSVNLERITRCCCCRRCCRYRIVPDFSINSILLLFIIMIIISIDFAATCVILCTFASHHHKFFQLASPHDGRDDVDQLQQQPGQCRRSTAEKKERR